MCRTSWAIPRINKTSAVKCLRRTVTESLDSQSKSKVIKYSRHDTLQYLMLPTLTFPSNPPFYAKICLALQGPPKNTLV